MRRARSGLGALLAMLIAVAAAEAQSRPGAPTAPGSPPPPPAPAGPSAPPSPTAAVADLSGVLLLVNARTGSTDTVVLRLSEALVAVSARHRAPDRAALSRLAVLLGEGLIGRPLTAPDGDRIATALSGALDGGAARDLARTLARVREALAASGLGAAEILLIETELRRVSVGR